ncbi:hypothetical protein [Pseudomonas paraveronii]|uniref:hypothetical protein n=1 Tax=Pseudomonas paraveronii TaxID=3040598 RepID=UPI002AB3081D|nr:hypothetical protein [Pseudomonas sp. V3/K/3/5]
MAKAKTNSDINDKYHYKDENPGGKRDAKLVSCAQCDDYNELSYICNEKLKPLIERIRSRMRMQFRRWTRLVRS